MRDLPTSVSLDRACVCSSPTSMQDTFISGSPLPSAPKETPRSVLQVDGYMRWMVTPAASSSSSEPGGARRCSIIGSTAATAPTPTLHLQDTFISPPRPAAPLKEATNGSAQVCCVRASSSWIFGSLLQLWQAGDTGAIQHASTPAQTAPPGLLQDTLITPASRPDGAEAPQPATQGQGEQQVRDRLCAM